MSNGSVANLRKECCPITKKKKKIFVLRRPWWRISSLKWIINNTMNFYLIFRKQKVQIDPIKLVILNEWAVGIAEPNVNGCYTHLSEVKCRVISWLYVSRRGPGSSVDIATGCMLDGPGIESRMGARFSAPVQTDPGPPPPASCTMGSGSFPEVKCDRSVTLTPHPLVVPRSRKSIPLLPIWAVRLLKSLVPVQGCTIPYLMLRDVMYKRYN